MFHVEHFIIFIIIFLIFNKTACYFGICLYSYNEIIYINIYFLITALKMIYQAFLYKKIFLI